MKSHNRENMLSKDEGGGRAWLFIAGGGGVFSDGGDGGGLYCKGGGMYCTGGKATWGVPVVGGQKLEPSVGGGGGNGGDGGGVGDSGGVKVT